MKIVFRLDAGSGIGLGHYMRCRALAEEFLKRGYGILFYISGDFVPDDNVQGIKCLELPALESLKEEASFLDTETADADILILDSYKISSEYIDFLNKKNRALICIDDNALYKYSCDFVINGNLFAENLKYETGKKEPKFLLGGKYTILRDAFKNLSPIFVRKNAEKIFICFGGADGTDFTKQVLDSLIAIDNTKLKVVLGSSYQGVLRKQKTDRANIYENPKDFAKIMRNADIGIISNSSMSYEAGSMGLPFISYTLAENQKLLGKYYSEKGLAISLGSKENFSSDRLICEAQGLIQNYAKRKEVSRKLQSSVNKNGSVNIANTILVELSYEKN